MPDILVRWLSPDCCEATVDAAIEPSLFRRLAWAAHHLRSELSSIGTTCGMRSLSVQWASPPHDPALAQQSILTALKHSWDQATATPAPRHQIPVHYTGPDLAALASYHELEPSSVIERHAGCVYTVAAVGFLPHFAYLWGLDPSLATPRRPAPRPRVPMGALGIAGSQTGVYPRDCPGGWNLIGQVPPAACAVLLPQLKVGDEVVFEALA